MGPLGSDDDSTSAMVEEEAVGTMAKRRAYRKSQCDEREDDDHSTVATVASSLSSVRRWSMETNLVNDTLPLLEESIDPSAILESRMLVKLAEQTSYEMQQVVAWWIDNKQDKDQEEALPNNILARPIDWWIPITTTPAATPLIPIETEAPTMEIAESLEFARIVSPVARSREEALEQSYLVDMIEERTRDMADFVDELHRVMMQHAERSQEPAGLSQLSGTTSIVGCRRLILLWIVVLVSLALVLVSCPAPIFVPADKIGRAHV